METNRDISEIIERGRADKGRGSKKASKSVQYVHSALWEGARQAARYYSISAIERDRARGWPTYTLQTSFLFECLKFNIPKDHNNDVCSRVFKILPFTRVSSRRCARPGSDSYVNFGSMHSSRFERAREFKKSSNDHEADDHFLNLISYHLNEFTSFFWQAHEHPVIFIARMHFLKHAVKI